jgi:hypothetical protein
MLDILKRPRAALANAGVRLDARRPRRDSNNLAVTAKGSMRGKLKRAGWDDAFLAQLLTVFNRVEVR